MYSSSKSNPIHAYTRATHTVAKTRQVVMLYDGVIRFLRQAGEAIEQGNIEARYLKLTKASEVISGLQNCLDFDAGQHTAQVLYDFYAAIDMRIVTLHRQADAAELQRIITELKEMRDVWDGIDRGQEPRAATVPASEGTPSPSPDDSGPGPVKVSA